MDNFSEKISLKVSKDFESPSKREVFDYPYKSMNIGDSFEVPLSKRQIVYNANFRAKKRLGISLTTQTIGEIIRVWRVA